MTKEEYKAILLEYKKEIKNYEKEIKEYEEKIASMQKYINIRKGAIELDKKIICNIESEMNK